jgi:ribosomal protein S18 acetylase RimI-like enzyme
MSSTQRPPIAVRNAGNADRPVAASVLARAFIDDPAMAFLFRDVADRPRRLARFFGLIASIDSTPELWSLACDAGGEPVAAALWRPPGLWKTPTSAMIANILPLLRVFGLTLPRALSMQSVIEAHHPHPPHWYLQFAGCVPESQGRGYGGAAIRARLRLCDVEGQPAALETATPSNVGLYESLGFRVTGTYQIKGGPKFWSMWRDPVA